MKPPRTLSLSILAGLLAAGSLAAQEITYAHIQADGSVVSLPNGLPAPSVQVESTGVYNVSYAAPVAPTAIPLLTARGTGTNWCKLDSFTQSSVKVRCFDVTEQPVANAFTVMLVPRENDRGILYAYADSPALTATYSPSVKYSPGNVEITKLITGRFRVKFFGISNTNVRSANVVAVGSNNLRCHVELISDSTLVVYVNCGTATGLFMDSAFTVALTLESTTTRAMGHFMSKFPTTSYKYGSITHTSDGQGNHTVVFGGLNLSGYAGNHAAVVTAYTTTFTPTTRYCAVGEATAASSGGISIPVKCYLGAAASGNVDFSLLVLPVEFLRNAGFESPFTGFSTLLPATAGWTIVDGAPLVQSSGATPLDGRQWVRLNNGGNSVIKQTIVTTPGAGYTIAFALANASGLPSSSVRVKWGGQVVSTPVRTATTFQTYSNDVYATGNTMELQFESLGSADLLDNVIVAYNPALPPPPSVTVTTSPAGQPITVDGTNYTAPQTFYWGAGSQHSLSIAAIINLNANSRLAFTQWTGPNYSNNSATVTITAPASSGTYTANLTQQYRVTVTSNPPAGGSVTANPAGSGGFYNSGANVQLTAVANAGYVFSNFTTLGGAVTTPFNPSTLTVSSVLTVTANFAACGYSINPTSASVPAAGGTGQVTVTAPAGCPWNVTGGSSWLLAAVNGNTVTYTASANTGTQSRTSSLTIAGIQFNVTQAGTQPCNYTLNTNSANVPAAGGTASFTVTTGAGCAWTADAGNSWAIRTGGASYTGTATVSYAVAVNTGAARSFNLTVAGQTVTITQAAGSTSCSYTLTPSDAVEVPAAGGVRQFTVTTGPGCQWSVPPLPSWITLLSPQTATGSGGFSLNIAPNTGDVRTFLLIIAAEVVSINQWDAASTPRPGLRFQPLEPCRILETRSDYNFPLRTGEFGPPFINAGTTRTLNPKQYPFCTIPAAAKAYVLNVTLIPRPGGFVDYATVWPAGDPRPNVYSVRTPDGQIVANSQIIAAGTNGAVSVYVSHNADVLLDISGYFTDDPVVSNLAFYPVTPCRVIETRSDYRPAPGQFGPPSMAARQTRSFRFPLSTDCPGIPPAAAYSVTLTVVPPAPLPFLTTWQTGIAQPNVSSINSFVGRTLANNVIVPANALGSIDVYAYEATDFIMDINGYFAPDDGVKGQFYYPTPQCRLYDTTAANAPAIAARSTRTIRPLDSTCVGLGQNARSFALNVTAIPNGKPMPFITLYPTGSQQPNASILNAFQGQTVTNFAIVPSGTLYGIELYAFEQTHAIVEMNGYFGR